MRSRANNSLIQVAPENVTVSLGGPGAGISLGTNNLIIDTYGDERGGTGFANGPTVGATLNIAGSISGSGNINVRSSQFGLGGNMLPDNGAIVFSADNTTFTGALTVTGEPTLLIGVTTSGPTNSLSSYESVTLNSNGNLVGITGPLQLTNALMTIDDTVVNNQNRIADNQVINLNQGGIQLNANTTLGTTETVGTVNLKSGLNQFRASNIASAITTLFQANNLVRSGNSTVQFFTSTATLGGAATNAAQFKFTQINGLSPTSSATTQTGTNVLVGSNGAAGTTNISIIPWAVGISTPVATTPTYSFVTYDANGIRALSLTTEYAANATSVAASNERDTSSAGTPALNASAAKTVNSLILDNTSTTAAAAYTLTNNMTITSGALMFTKYTSGRQRLRQGRHIGWPRQCRLWRGGRKHLRHGQRGCDHQHHHYRNRWAHGERHWHFDSLRSQFRPDRHHHRERHHFGHQSGHRLGRHQQWRPVRRRFHPFNCATASPIASTRTVTLLANSFRIGFDTSGTAGTVASQITGSGDLVKLGSAIRPDADQRHQQLHGPHPDLRRWAHRWSGRSRHQQFDLGQRRVRPHRHRGRDELHGDDHRCNTGCLRVQRQHQRHRQREHQHHRHGAQRDLHLRRCEHLRRRHGHHLQRHNLDRQ